LVAFPQLEGTRCPQLHVTGVTCETARARGTTASALPRQQQ